ncbi:MAG: GNAT family N-acetyltransferase [Gemmatimonas sp.]|nr:GNAT family N-acetyltransferase [Gemmatimonas sp.]
MSHSIILTSMACDVVLEDPALYERAEGAPRSPVSRKLLATNHGQTVALVVLDVWPGEENVILYELFVPPRLWRQGVGSATLVAIEAYVRNLGRTRLELDARPLTNQLAQGWLESWYEKRGYVRFADKPERFRKELHRLP